MKVEIERAEGEDRKPLLTKTEMKKISEVLWRSDWSYLLLKMPLQVFISSWLTSAKHKNASPLKRKKIHDVYTDFQKELQP